MVLEDIHGDRKTLKVPNDAKTQLLWLLPWPVTHFAMEAEATISQYKDVHFCLNSTLYGPSENQSPRGAGSPGTTASSRVLCPGSQLSLICVSTFRVWLSCSVSQATMLFLKRAWNLPQSLGSHPWPLSSSAPGHEVSARPPPLCGAIP